MKTLMYAYDTETGMVVSRLDSEIAIPILQYDQMTAANNFKTQYKLEKMNVLELAHSWHIYKWTRKIPLDIKNVHRKFWGMKPLKRRANSHEMTALWKDCRFRHGGRVFTVLKVVPSPEGSDWDAVILQDDRPQFKKCPREWNFGGMLIYLKEHPDAVEHATMGVIRLQITPIEEMR